MLPRINRLTTNYDFDKVRKEGKLTQGKYFGLVVRNQKTKDPSRFGFVVSTKISKKAVERNRVKRILRAAVKNLLNDIRGGFDIIFLAKKTAVGASKEEIDKEINRLFSILEII